MTGSDLKKLREEFGLSAEEFARHLASIEAPITTGRSIYRLEARNRVPRWCVEALREYVGDDAFRRALADLGVADAEGAPTTERDREPTTVGYYVVVRGSKFDPRRVKWPEGEADVSDMEIPGATYTSRRGKEYVAEDGRATLSQPTPLHEINLFTEADPVLRFLIQNHDHLRSVGAEEVVVMIGFYRDGQMNAELDREQIANLCRAGAKFGFSFYEV